jgi:hypothetical protein
MHGPLVARRGAMLIMFNLSLDIDATMARSYNHCLMLVVIL